MEAGKSPSLAAMRVADYGAAPEECEGEPWTKAWFNRCPGHGEDQWIETLRSEGWLVRSHQQWRARTFHPLHKTLPLEARELTGVRVSVGFDEENNKVVKRDDWMMPPTNLFEPKKQWKGWTFLQLKRPSENNYGGKLRGVVTMTPKAVEGYHGIEKEEVEIRGESSATSSSSQGLGHGKGYAMGSTSEKGVIVASQLPRRPSGLKEVETDQSLLKVQATVP